jgi:hypothetical protein
VAEILPTYRVSRGRGPVRRPPESAATANLAAIAVIRADGSAGTVGDVLADTFTDAYAVLQDAELVTEWYGPLGAQNRTHALMSVSKSVVGWVSTARCCTSAAEIRTFFRTNTQPIYFIGPTAFNLPGA